jgi:DNA-binding response OmpR family regulator
VPRRILLIDDTPEVAELLSFALRDHGYDVTVTGYTTAVNELAVEAQADAVVVGCSLFDMSESLFDTLRHEERHATLPVVIISDMPDEAVASLRARRATHVRLVPKPFTGSQVVLALADLLDPADGEDRPESR